MTELSAKRSQSRRSLPRLALLTLDFAPQMGGVQEYLYEVAQRLVSAYDVAVLTPVRGALPPSTKLQRIQLADGTFSMFWQQLRRLNPSLVIVGHAHPRLMLAAALQGRYAVIAYGNDFLAAQQRWHRPIFNMLLRRASPLITVSRASARRLQALGAGDAVVVRPGADSQRFSPPAVWSDERPPTLLTMGRLVQRKGIDTVLRALPRLMAEFPGLQYLIGGEGPDRERLQRLAAELNLLPMTHFLGRVAPEKLPDVYRQADIFVMLSREEVAAGNVEGFGIVFLEASASGLPVVAARSGGSVEAVKDGETGFLVEPDDPTQAAEALATLLRDTARRREMGIRGRQWVVREMNWNRTGEEMKRLLAAEFGVRAMGEGAMGK